MPHSGEHEKGYVVDSEGSSDDNAGGHTTYDEGVKGGDVQGSFSEQVDTIVKGARSTVSIQQEEVDEETRGSVSIKQGIVDEETRSSVSIQPKVTDEEVGRSLSVQLKDAGKEVGGSFSFHPEAADEQSITGQPEIFEKVTYVNIKSSVETTNEWGESRSDSCAEGELEEADSKPPESVPIATERPSKAMDSAFSGDPAATYILDEGLGRAEARPDAAMGETDPESDTKGSQEEKETDGRTHQAAPSVSWQGDVAVTDSPDKQKKSTSSFRKMWPASKGDIDERSEALSHDELVRCLTWKETQTTPGKDPREDGKYQLTEEEIAQLGNYEISEDVSPTMLPKWYIKNFPEEKLQVFRKIFVLLDCQGDESVNNKTMFGQISKLDVGLTQDDVDNVLAALQSDTKQVDFDDFLYKIAQLGATDPTQRRFTKRQMLCYTAIVKFAVTNSTWDINKYRKRKMYKLDYSPLDINQIAGLDEDRLTLHYEKMKEYIETSPIYDPNSPYTDFTWYVHVEDPGYKPNLPTKQWTPYTERAPRRTTLGVHADPRMAEFKRRRSAAIRCCNIKQKQLEAAKAAGGKQSSVVGEKSHTSSTHRASRPSLSHGPSQPSSIHRPSQSISPELSVPPEPPEVTSQPPIKSVLYYRKLTVSYYQKNRDMRSPTVRQVLKLLDKMRKRGESISNIPDIDMIPAVRRIIIETNGEHPLCSSFRRKMTKREIPHNYSLAQRMAIIEANKENGEIPGWNAPLTKRTGVPLPRLRLYKLGMRPPYTVDDLLKIRKCAEDAMDTYLTALRHNFVRRAWVNWKGLRSDQFFSPLLRQCFKRCYRCLSPATEEMVFVRAPSAPKPYSMGQFSHVNTDYSNVLSKPIRIPKFDRGPPPCPQSIVPATPWSRGPIPPRRPRTCIPKHSGTPCPLSITPVTRCARAPTPPCRPGSCFMRPPATPIEALSS